MNKLFRFTILFLLIGCRTLATEYRRALKQSPPLLIYDVYISDWNNRCRVRCYDVLNGTSYPLNICDPTMPQKVAMNLDITECNSVAGYSLEDWSTKIIPLFKKLKYLAENLK